MVELAEPERTRVGEADLPVPVGPDPGRAEPVVALGLRCELVLEGARLSVARFGLRLFALGDESVDLVEFTAPREFAGTPFGQEPG